MSELLIEADNMPEFKLDEWILKETISEKRKTVIQVKSDLESFMELCEKVKLYLNNWEGADDLLMMQRKAIIGYEQEVNFFKDKINEYLKAHKLTNNWFPSWYTDLISGVFQQNWGFAGIDEWLRNEESSSAKMIGEKIFFLDRGKQILQKQTMSNDRIKQLIMALMLNAPEKRMDDGYTEVYMLNGNRITIYDDAGKEPYIIYRKYTMKQYTFKEQARLETIAEEQIPLFEEMIKIGYNVNFLGPVRTGKTTFLITWQSLEDPTLEGIMVETDPEIPLHLIMPNAPIMQLVADDERLRKLMKSLMRSDGDYLIMAEARDGVALKTAVQAGSKGTRRVKSTFHTGEPEDFCYDAASEIVQEFGGDVFAQTIKVAKTYQYLFSFSQLKDKSKKKLKGLYEIRYNKETMTISTHQIIKYNPLTNDWSYKFDIGEDKRQIALEEDYLAFEKFRAILKSLSEKNEIKEEHVTVLPYLNFMKK